MITTTPTDRQINTATAAPIVTEGKATHTQRANAGQPSFARVLSTTQADELGTDSPPPASAGRDAELQWAATQLEAFFLQQVLAGFRRMVPTSQFSVGSSFAAGTYQEMLDAERAKDMARAGGIGLAALVYEQMR